VGCSPAMAVAVEGVVGIAGRKRGDLEPRRRPVAECYAICAGSLCFETENANIEFDVSGFVRD
jgi:hypothetical protein